MASREAGDPNAIAQEICASVGAELEAERGAGSFKNVYRITLPDGEVAALKLVRSPSASPRVQREIEAGRRTDHPSIASLLEVGTHEFGGDNYTYYFEELLEGGSLADRLERGATLSENEVLDLGRPLLEALAHLSDLGLVHRDIKPANIMFRASGSRPVLVDFGLVRDLEATSLTPSFLGQGPGTPYYAAPEQLNNEKDMIDWRSDQFCLGVVLGISHFGFHPYQTADERLFEEGTVRRMSARGDRRPEFVERCRESRLSPLLRMTEQWPVDRYPSADAAVASWRDGGDC